MRACDCAKLFTHSNLLLHLPHLSLCIYQCNRWPATKSDQYNIHKRNTCKRKGYLTMKLFLSYSFALRITRPKTWPFFFILLSFIEVWRFLSRQILETSYAAGAISSLRLCKISIFYLCKLFSIAGMIPFSLNWIFCHDWLFLCLQISSCLD